MGNNFARLLPVLNDAPIVIPIRHEFCGATRFDHAYRRVLEGRINAATFNSRIDEINFITSDHAPSRFLALLPPLAAIFYLILYIIVLAERIGMENYEIHPALTIIFMPFAVAMVQLLAWLWSNHQSEKLFTKIESQLQINNRKDNAKGVLWRLHRELPMDHFDNCSRVLCWSCYFPKLYCGIVLEFIPPAMSNNQQPLAMQPVMTYAQGLQPNASTTLQPPLQTHSHHSSQIGAGTRPQSFMPTPNHQHQQSGSGSGSGPFQPQFAKPASPQPVFSPSQKVDDTNYFQNMQFPQPQHFSPNQSQVVAAPSAPPAQSGGLYPFEALGVSGSGYAAQAAQEAPPVYKEKWQASQ